jgi:hypothetical protein
MALAVRRWRLLLLGAACAALLTGVAWIVVTGLLARADLSGVRAGVAQLRSDLLHDRPAAAQADLVRLRSKISSGHARTTGPAWWLAAQVPWLGSPAQTTRELAEDGRELTEQVLPRLISAATTLDPHQLRVAPDRIDLTRVEAAQASLTQALPIATRVDHQVDTMSGSWLGPVSHERTSLLGQLDGLLAELRGASTAAQLLPPMLGADGPRRYLVVFEGDTEARGVGGIMGGYGLVDADDGRLHFQHFGSDRDFSDASADVDLGRDFDQLYAGDDPEQIVANADLSPHFPYAAQIWSSMAQHIFGVPIDGVVAVDPAVMAGLLSVTGPVQLADGTTLTSANLVQELDVDVYQRFNDNTVARKAFFVGAAKAVVDALLSRHLDAEKLLDSLVDSANDRGLLAYSAVPAEEAQLAKSALGGALPETSRPFVGVVLNNSSATKLDGYLREHVVYQRRSCSAGPATVTVQLTNTAPASGLPSYVTQGLSWTGPHTAGTDSLLVSLYGTEDSEPQDATIDGRVAYVDSGDERGHPVTMTPVSIPPGATRVVVFTVDEPAATGPVVVLRQPLVTPPTVVLHAPTCPAS